VTIVVAAAVVRRDGRYLVTRRPRGAHLEGLWEFPGGKCEPGESIAACLRRELLEELGTDAVVGEEMLAVTHDYVERSIELHFLACELTREPAPLLGQEMRWIARHELRSLQFPPADDELIALLERNEG
jgi:8-oxo-dGTP diphosphatase